MNRLLVSQVSVHSVIYISLNQMPSHGLFSLLSKQAVLYLPSRARLMKLGLASLLNMLVGIIVCNIYIYVLLWIQADVANKDIFHGQVLELLAV